MSVGLNEKVLTHLYSVRGFSDAEIAQFFGVDRTTIVHARQKFEIKTRKSVGELGEEYVERKLIQLGHRVKNLNEDDKTSLFDLLVNNKIRIEVKTANAYRGRFLFSLTNKKESNHVESPHRVILKNGRTLKLYRKTCDYIICVGFLDEIVYPFIIPSNLLNSQKQNISISLSKDNAYMNYLDRWDLIKRMI